MTSSESPMILVFWGTRDNPSLPSLLGPLWPGVVAPDRVLSMNQIEMLHIHTMRKQITYARFNC